MKRKELRRMRYLASILKPLERAWYLKYEYNVRKELKPNYDELYSLFDKAGFTDKEAHDFFWHNTRTYSGTVYNKKPVQIRKDNKTSINSGTGNRMSSSGKIRYPKKCRKTAWKRFYRLFPRLKPQD